MSVVASLWVDRDPEFSLILNVFGLDIIIKNPYIYNNNEWFTNYNLINDDKNFVMYFDNIILKIQNESFMIINKDIIYELNLDKSMILNCFSVIINSKSILRYEYWGRPRSLIKL